MGCSRLSHIDIVRCALALAVTFCSGLANATMPEIGTRYLARDARGDVTLATDGGGKAVQSNRYGPWGDLIRESREEGIQPGFTGQELDSATGLHYFNARYYDAKLGRFLSPDPLNQFRSPYLYAFDAPLEFVDPTGKGGEFFSPHNPFEAIYQARNTRLLIDSQRQTFGVTLRDAYYFHASASYKGRVYTPTVRTTGRLEDVHIALNLNETNWKQYFEYQDLDGWMNRQEDQSIVAIFRDHGHTDPRIEALPKQVDPYSSKYIACIDTGCNMKLLDDNNGNFVADGFADVGITYIASDEIVTSLGFHPDRKRPYIAGGKQYRTDWKSTAELPSEAIYRRYWPYIESYVMTEEPVFVGVNLAEPGLASHAPQSWFYRIPDSADFRFTSIAPERYTHRSGVNEYRVLKYFDFNHYD